MKSYRIDRSYFDWYFDILCLVIMIFTLFWVYNPSILNNIFNHPIRSFALGVVFLECTVRGVFLLTELFLFFIPEEIYKKIKKWYDAKKRCSE